MFHNLHNKMVLTGIFFPVLVLYFGIWHVYMSAFEVYAPSISDEVVLSSRDYSQNLKKNLENIHFSDLMTPSIRNESVKLADQLLDGKLILDTYPRLDKNDPFNDEIALAESSSWRLAYAGFIIPSIYLEAYKKTNDGKYLNAAMNYILEWAQKESDTWSPIKLIINDKGTFVWNDHAVALRSEVLVDLWTVYYSQPEFEIKKGRTILSLASRYASFLSRNSNYTYKTNHGMMQNLANMKMIAVFPEIKYIQNLKQLTVRNLKEQFNYLINDEGVITENSAGYNSNVLHLVSNALQLFKFTGVEIEADLMIKYNLGVSYLKAIRRPDGTLPKYGDTNSNYDENLIKMINLNQPEIPYFLPIDNGFWKPESDNTIKLGTGYAVWWSGLNFWPDHQQLTQTVINWSYYPLMAHFHDDELSFNIWKAGQEWWSSVGYWPYSDDRRNMAVSWTTSNAPHLLKEPEKSERSASILSNHSGDRIKFIDLNRVGPGGFQARRQILVIDGTIWIILDSFKDTEERRAQIAWNLHHTLNSQYDPTFEKFSVNGENTSLEMDVFYRGSPSMEIQKIHGSDAPLSGWTTIGEDIIPADAFIVQVPSSGGWAVNVSIIDNYEDEAKPNALTSFNKVSDTSWKLALVHKGKNLSIFRSDELISVSNTSNQTDNIINIQTIENNITNNEEVALELAKAGEIHGKRFLPLINYRKKMSLMVLGLIFANSLVLYFVRRRKWLSTLSISVSVVFFSWLYYWLANIYFFA